jgi:hypothetical protein
MPLQPVDDPVPVIAAVRDGEDVEQALVIVVADLPVAGHDPALVAGHPQVPSRMASIRLPSGSWMAAGTDMTGSYPAAW